jgi:peroxiredoxin
MAQFGPEAEKFRQQGVSVVFIAAEKRAGMFKPEEFLRRTPAPFPFLLDEDREVTKRYGVYHRLGMDAINIARPATFVVDGKGIVTWMFIGASQTDRAPVERVMEEAAKAKTT